MTKIVNEKKKNFKLLKLINDEQERKVLFQYIISSRALSISPSTSSSTSIRSGSFLKPMPIIVIIPLFTRGSEIDKNKNNLN